MRNDVSYLLEAESVSYPRFAALYLAQDMHKVCWCSQYAPG